MDIAFPWDHRGYEKEGEKIEKYQDLKREIGKLWDRQSVRHLEVVPVVVGALGGVRKRLDKLGIIMRTSGLLQKTALLGTARILRKVLER